MYAMGRPRKNPPLGETAPALTKKIGLLPEFFDINTGTDLYWETLLKCFSKIARVYGFSRVEAPIVEDVKLFQRFYDQTNLDFLVRVEQDSGFACLRPSLLPGLFRYFVQQKLGDVPGIHKWHHSGFVVRSNIGGHMTSDYEFGCEILGNFNHLSEAQSIAAAWEFLSALDLGALTLEVNNLGSLESQANYGRVLADILLPKKYELCDNCGEFLVSKPIKILLCENLDCQAVWTENAPTILDFLDQDSHKDFTSVLEALDEMNIPYQLNAFHVGRESHEKTNFVIKSQVKGHILNLVEGGHHSALLQSLGARTAGTRAFGFYGSLKLLREIMADANPALAKHINTEVCLVPLGELAAKRSLRLFRDLTAEKILVYDHFGLSGVKNQLKIAQEHKVPIALIMGQKEAMDEVVILRDVKSGMQEIISYDKIVEEVKKRLGK